MALNDSNMSTETHPSSSFQLHQPKKSTRDVKRIYVGNLRSRPELEERLLALFGQSGISVHKDGLTVVRKNSSCFALVACDDVKHAISCLNGAQFDGRRLVVQREKKGGGDPRNSCGKKSFGGGWSRPSSDTVQVARKQQSEVKPLLSSKTQAGTAALPNNVQTRIAIDEKKPTDLAFDTTVNEFKVSELIGDAISSEIKASEENPLNGDALNAAIASTAATALIGSMNGFNLDNNPNPAEKAKGTDPGNKAATSDNVADTFDDENKDEITLEDFRLRCKQPLETLLADYGEQDVDFAKRKPTVELSVAPEEEPMATARTFQNQLVPQGKAPIHVEVVSFGYNHGIPTEIRDGWSHAHPLSPTDCRHLPMVPPYLVKQNGLSYSVKRALINAAWFNEDGSKPDENKLKACANEIAEKAVRALEEAVAAGYGHASPLRMTIYAGSESGRHRSVAVCEMAATFIRAMLRKNQDNRITQPTSVGTRHRDIERRKRDDDQEQKRDAKSKQKELESSWYIN